MNTYRISPPDSRSSIYSSVQEYEYAGWKQKLAGIPDSSDEEGMGNVDHVRGYTNLGLVIDQKLKREGKYVRDTLAKNRRQSYGAPYKPQ